TATRVFTAPQIAQIVASNPDRLYIYGLIEYVDVFNEKRETRFCVSVKGQGLSAMQTGTAGPGPHIIEFEAADQHNSFI
ncbi:MAG TPA: hypothetical protein VK690_08075, partial [Stellaceae bacterium]|nr:hypothetical protein [Stellaceae bacterium]